VRADVAVFAGALAAAGFAAVVVAGFRTTCRFDAVVAVTVGVEDPA
jgi:hypothetical protein